MDRRLVEATLSGNEATLNALIQEDPFILHRISLTSFNDTPLHMASSSGNLDFVRAILCRKPAFLTKTDSFGRYPLHLACAEGHVEIVKMLFRACPEVVQRRDQDGRTPLELAALNGQVSVLMYLLQENPLLVKMGTASDSGETILHICIRNNSIEALKLLVNSWSRDEVINCHDRDGNNLLHVAVIHKQIGTVKYLLGEVGIGEKWNSINKNGFTAVDVLDHYPRDWRSLELHGILMKSNVRRAEELQGQTQSLSHDSILRLSKNILYGSKETSNVAPMSSSHPRKLWKFLRQTWNQNIEKENNWAEKIRGNLLVAATLIATISFQAGLNPPGGVWQDSDKGHIPGTSIMASRNFEAYINFITFNTVALISSSSIILLMISGFPLNSKILMAILMVTMTFTILLMLSTYSTSVLNVFTPDRVHHILSIFRFAMISWNCIFYIVILFYVIRFLVWLLAKCRYCER